MDILTHTLSGVAIGTVMASFSKRGFREKMGIISIAGFGGALPDIDAISLWSKFDNTIGRFFGLYHSGKEIYFLKFWYSHHGFLHSFFASLVIAFIIGICIYLIKSRQKSLSIMSLFLSFKSQRLLLISFVLGFVIHLIEDMPTPASVWGGVNFLWPMKSYIGGIGDLWWWNNYDIFLIASGIVLLNLLVLLISGIRKINSRKLTTTIFIVGLTLSLVQVKTRGFDFNYTGHTPKYQEYEQKSKAIQKEILGVTVYNLMLEFDNNMSLNF